MKKFIELFIDRPVLASAISILLLLLGLYGSQHLTLRLYPKLNIPVVSIDTMYHGASADVMKSYVTSVIQDAISGVKDIDYLSSSSAQGKSHIEAHMKVGSDLDTALSALMGKVAAIRNFLPKNADEPVISSAQDQSPLMILAFTSQQWTREHVADYLRRNIQADLESQPGMERAEVLGGTYAMRIWLDPERVASYGLTAEDIIGALQSQNVQATPGSSQGHYNAFDVSITSDLSTPEQFKNIIIKRSNNALVTLNDVAKVKLGPVSDKISGIYNGKNAVMVMIHALPSANPLSVANYLHKAFPKIMQHLPSAVQMEVVLDTSHYMRTSISETIYTIIEAVLIVTLVVFLFVGSIRGAIIPVITIPLSLIGTLFFLYLMNYSINTLTLLALVLAIGLVVDDAIVVIENIHRHIETGLTPFQAARKGIVELITPIIAMTITLAAVFAPIGFSSGFTGQLFREFAFTLSGAVILSGVIALILAPTLSANLLKIQSGKFTKILELAFHKIQNIYGHLLIILLKRRTFVLFVWLGICVATCFLYSSLPRTLTPNEDQGFLQVIATAPQSTNTEFLLHNTNKLNKIYSTIPEMENYLYINGIPNEHQVLSFLPLKDWNQRQRTAMELQPYLQGELKNMIGMHSMAILPSSLPGGSGMPVQFVIKSDMDYQKLYQLTETLKQVAQQNGPFLFLQSDLHYDQPYLKININRPLAAQLGVSVNSITNALSTFWSGGRAQQYSHEGRTYDVIPEADKSYRMNPADLDIIHVKTSEGNLIPLSVVTNFETTVLPAGLNQFQKLNSVTLSGSLKSDISLKDGIDYLQQQAKKLLPSNVQFDYSGVSRQYKQEESRLLGVFLSAIAVIFLVLAMQFESYWDPLIILFGSVPMSMLGALLGLKWFGQSLNIYTVIGLLTLIGLISKHGILLTHMANQIYLSEEVSVRNAIVRAGIIRLRPILMTTAAMIFGVLPLLTASGAGSVSRFDMGLVIALGMSIGTVFTLFILPAIYEWIASKKDKKEKIRNRIPQQTEVYLNTEGL